MPVAFSVASWNVEHLRDRDPRNAERIEFLAEHKPDVIGIYEVEGKNVWSECLEKLPGYAFFITEGERNTQQIMVGVGPEVSGFLTQKLEYNAEASAMRPGALLTVRANGVDYSLLFLHVASWPKARGFGLRADMLSRALEFKKTLDGLAPSGKANFMFMGDLNTMGLDFVYGREPAPSDDLLHARVTGEQEISGLAHAAGAVDMRILPKNAAATWRDLGSRKSNLDHVVASSHLRFTKFGDAEVDVRGWPALADNDAQEQWTKDFSDHGLLYFEVHDAG